MGFPDPGSSPEEFSALTDVPLFLGYVFSYLLQGILIVQIFIYYIAFPKDPRWMKIVVAFLFFVELLSTFFATFAALWSIVASGDLFDLTNLWGFKTLGPLCGVASLTVHAFYARRIYQIGGRRYWTLLLLTIIVLLSIAQCFSVIWTGTQSYLGVGEGQPLEVAFVTVWLIGSAICDVIIAISLVILLPRASRSLTGDTAKLRVEKLMTVIVETGMITAFGALCELMFFYLFRNTLIHYILFYMLPKIYSNCMLAALNARISARNLRSNDTESQTPLVDVRQSRRFSNIQVGNDVFHIVTEDGKMMPLSVQRETFKEFDEKTVELELEEVDDVTVQQNYLPSSYPKQPAAIATTNSLSFHLPLRATSLNQRRPLPQPGLASNTSSINKVSPPRALPIPPLVPRSSASSAHIETSESPNASPLRTSQPEFPLSDGNQSQTLVLFDSTDTLEQSMLRHTFDPPLQTESASPGSDSAHEAAKAGTDPPNTPKALTDTSSDSSPTPISS